MSAATGLEQSARLVQPDPRLERAVALAIDAGETGVQVAAYLGEDVIADTWAGEVEPESGRTVDGRSLFPVFSVTKAITVTALHMQVDRGLVDYDAPVCRYWPEFACNGKESITIRHVLTHRAGIPQMPSDVTPERMADWDWMVGHVARLTPLFPSGTTSAYHSLVFGWIVGEVVHRVDPKRRGFGAIVREDICMPLGIHDLWLGVPDDEIDRVAILGSDMTEPDNAGSLAALAMPREVAPGPEVHNLREVRQACIPGAGAIMSARAGARFFAMLANGGTLGGRRLLREASVWSFTEPRDNPGELDRAIGGGGVFAPPVGIGGYWLSEPGAGTAPHMLCHGGAGGSIGWAELDRHLSVVICHNRMFDSMGPAAVSPHPFEAIADAIRTLADEQLEPCVS